MLISFLRRMTLLRDVAERFVPLRSVRCREGHPLLTDAEYRAVPRDCCRLERLRRRSGRPDDRLAWMQATGRRFGLYREKEEAYWTHRFEQCGRSPPLLWRSLSSKLQRNRDVSASTNHTVDGFAAYFSKTIDAIRCATANLPSPEVSPRTRSKLSSLRPCTPVEVQRIVMTSPIKSRSLDPVPTFFVREFIDLFLPYISSLM